jgi:hypothetical protein
VLVREGVRLAVHTSLAIRTILTSIAILGGMRHVVVVVPASIIVHWAVAAVLVSTHLAHVRSVVRVGEIWVLISVVMSALAGHVLCCRSLSSARKGGVGGVVAAVGCVNVTIAAGRLSGRNMGLHFCARDAKSSCGSLGNGSILGLTIGAIVVVGKTLIDGVERRILTARRHGRLDRSLVGKWFLDLRLRLGDLLAKGIVGLVSISVAGEIVEGGIGSGDLRNWRKSRGWAGDGGALGRSLSLALGRRRQSGTRSYGGVLRGLSTSFSIFTVLVNINISSITVQSHATKLHRSPIHCMVSRHDHCFLLFHNTALSAGSTNALPECACWIGMCRSRRCSGSSSHARVQSAANSASRSSCGGGRRDIGELGKIRPCQIVLRGYDFGRRSRFFERLRDNRLGCLFHGNGDWRWDRNGRKFSSLLLFLFLLFFLFDHWLGSRLLGNRSGFRCSNRCRSWSRNWCRCRSSRLLLGRRRGFREQARPALLSTIRDHTALRRIFSALVRDVH